jgi:hypothetical protein
MERTVYGKDIAGIIREIEDLETYDSHTDDDWISKKEVIEILHKYLTVDK